MKKTQLILGIMSGTSLDGVDYGLCEIGPNQKIKLKKLWSVDYTKPLKAKLLAAASNQLSSYEVCQLNHDLGRFYADHAPKVQCDYIGLHGQTIFHNPNKSNPATSQIGEPAYLVAKLKKPVVSQFRTMDLAMGGQGAPLATFFHKTVFGDSSKIVAVNNLGGISNVTYLGKNKTLSFDTGPANILMDYAIAKISHGKKQRDENGMVAARGIPKTALINSWLSHSFFGKKPPKSTGREEFGREYFEKTWQALKKSKASDEDCMATYCEFTAKSIALNYARHLPRFPEQVVLSGGGAENPTLVKFIRRSLREAQWSLDKNIKTPVEVVTSASLGWPSQSIEASAFALLAYQTINGRPGNLPETTGASRAAILGQISPAP